MTFLRRIFTNWWVLSGLAVALSALIFFTLLPTLFPPLAGLFWRLGFLVALVLAWAAAAAVRVLSARAASDRIAGALTRERGAEADEGALVGRRVTEALGQLKAQGGRKRDYLYSQPWYVMIGPPGAGKTTALGASGLRFPFTDTVARGVGGTRNIDFMFADEAVLVDTAGRYTSQDAGEARDRQGWLRFLDALRRNRPLQPINGALVAIGVDTLLTSDVAEIDRHADIIRRRLAELREGLEISAPVYVVFTKTDLLAGFSEYFDDLDADQRREVLGSTFPAEATGIDAAAVARAFDEVSQAVANRSPRRLQAEMDARRRGLILAFPSQFDGLRNAVARLIEGAFPPNAREGAARLRGFYFTSGIQEGTPLDRLLAGVATVRDAPAPSFTRGKAYFINQLLTDVIFAEAGLAEGTASAKARRSALLNVALVSIAAVSAVALVLFVAGAVANYQFENQARTQATDASVALQAPGVSLTTYSENDLPLSELAKPLDQLRDLPRGYAAKGGPGFPLNWLYQRDLAADEHKTYLGVLQRVMLPRLINRLQVYQSENVGDPIALYAALKTYLLLGGQESPSLTPQQAADAKAWIVADLAREGPLAGPDAEDKRRDLAQHLDALLGERPMQPKWTASPVRRDVIDASRNVLQGLSLAQRIYAAIRAESFSGNDWRLADNVDSGKLVAFANAPDFQNDVVPFLFTKAGYRAFVARLNDLDSLVREDKWVVNSEAPPDPDIKAEVSQLYVTDYVKRWTDVLDAPKPSPEIFDPLDNAMENPAQYAMFGEDSAYKHLLNSVLDQVVLTPNPQAGVGDIGSQITNAFADLTKYVRTDQSLDRLLDGLKTQVASLSDLRSSTTLGGAPAPGAPAATPTMTASLIGAPPAIASFFGQAQALSKTAAASAQVANLQTVYGATQKQACGDATNGYPFLRGGNDLAVDKVTAMFGDQGPFSQIITALGADLDTSGDWHLAPDAPPGLSAQTPERLRQARAIGEILQPNGLQLSVTAQVAHGSATLTLGDETVTFTQADPGPKEMKWFPAGNGFAQLTFPGQARPYRETGPWAVLRLFQQGSVNSRATGTVTALFGGGGDNVTFTIGLPAGSPNPFGTDPWAFRCPDAL